MGVYLLYGNLNIFFRVTEQYEAAVGTVQHLTWKKVKVLFICSLHFDFNCTCKCVCLSKTIKNSIKTCDVSTLKPSLLLPYPDENGNQDPDPDPDPDQVEREAALLSLCDHDYVNQLNDIIFLKSPCSFL